MRKLIPVSALLVWLLVSCGWTDSPGNVSQGNTINRLEAMSDPAGFERIGIDLLNDGEFAPRYEGGYEVTWVANGESPESVMESFLPVLGDVGYVTLEIDETSCTADELRLFLIFEVNFSSSSSLTYDIGSDVVRFRSNWDRSSRLSDDVLGEVPVCS